MKTIQLTQGKIAIIDAEDFEKINKHMWRASRSENSWRATTVIKRKTIFMHREILNASVGIQVDHIDGNGLNN